MNYLQMSTECKDRPNNFQIVADWKSFLRIIFLVISTFEEIIIVYLSNIVNKYMISVE